MSSTFQSRAALEQTQAQKEHNVRVRLALDEIYATRFDGKVLKPTQATTREIIRMCAEYHGMAPGVCVPSVQTMQEIFKLQRQVFTEVFSSSLLVTVEEARRDVIEDILIALRCSRPSITEFELAQEKGKLANGFTLQALRNRLHYILEAQRLARKSKPEIEQEVREIRTAAQPLPEQLPQEYTPQLLREKLRTMTREATERFIARWGLEKINARLQGRDSFLEVQQ